MRLPTWVVVVTKPAAEEVAERGFRAAGYRVCLLRYRKILSPHGRDRRGAMSMRPLFSRLLFVQDWRGWPDPPVAGTVSLMSVRPGKPVEISDELVAELQERERVGEFDE